MIWLIGFVLLTCALRGLVLTLAAELYGLSGWYLDATDVGDRRLAWLAGAFFSVVILILVAVFSGRL